MLEMSQIINEITLENYRCFHERQVAPLAPLTLLVGENSTGKTSFLAMIRALWDCIYGYRVPNFKEEPFDLGSFEEIAYRKSERGKPASTFEAKIRINQDWVGEFVFGQEGTIPVPIKIRHTDKGNWIEQSLDNEGNLRMYVGTSRGEWETPRPVDNRGATIPFLTLRHLLTLNLPDIYFHDEYAGPPTKLIPLNGSPAFSDQDADSIRQVRLMDPRHDRERPFASAPVRSDPLRTYNPATSAPDPRGYYIPMLLAEKARKDDDTWRNLKKDLERFGSSCGLFDEIHIEHLGNAAGAPFQIQIRKFGNTRKGVKHNLMDVGFGVSQVLPILTELLLPENTRMALLQQPEEHLHPRGQTALGTLLCKTAAQGRQLVIEPHSDYLIDRICMDIRDGTTGLNPEDISILFFERNDLSIQIHAIQIDKMGNVLDAPDSYRRFFMEETKRSLGI